MKTQSSRVSSAALQLVDTTCYLECYPGGQCYLKLQDDWSCNEDDQQVSDEFARAWVKEFGWDEDADNYKPSNEEEEEDEDDD